MQFPATAAANPVRNRTAILVLNYKKYTDALNLLASVVEHEIQDADVIILDNASGNDSVSAIVQWTSDNFPLDSYDVTSESEMASGSTGVVLQYVKGRVAVFSSPTNLGFSGGNNALARIAIHLGYEFLYCVNSDILFTDKFSISKHISLHEREPMAYVSGPCVINLDGSFDSPYTRDTFWGDVLYYAPLNFVRRKLGLPIVQFAFSALSQPAGAQVYKVSGAAMFFPAGRFTELAGFDENVWLSSEEAILGEKVLARGGKTMYLPTTVVLHAKASAPRESTKKADILRNHFRQRNYYYRTYRGYKGMKLVLLKIGQALRVALASR